jgi:hypothetical protein
MKLDMKALASLLLLGAVACGDSGSAGQSDESDETASADTYAFQLPGPNDKMQRVDAMGIALLSTVLMNRDRTPSGDDNGNGYQNASPDVQNDPRTLIGFIHFLRALHNYWHDDLARQGFEPCSDKVLGLIVATPCTLQHLRFDDDPSVEGPRVIDAVLPDYITLDFDQPLRFPNGRTPWEQISDKVFALGFVKMGGKCPGLDTTAGVSDETKGRAPRDADGVPICTLETFADLPLQVAQNDKPFEQDFPYLAKPWFYSPQEESKTTYFWPTTSRLETPE